MLCLFDSSAESLEKSGMTSYDISQESKNGIKIKTLNDNCEYTYQSLQDIIQTTLLTRDAEKEKKEHFERYHKFMNVKKKIDVAVSINSARIHYVRQGGRGDLNLHTIQPTVL